MIFNIVIVQILINGISCIIKVIILLIFVFNRLAEGEQV